MTAKRSNRSRNLSIARRGVLVLAACASLATSTDEDFEEVIDDIKDTLNLSNDANEHHVQITRTGGDADIDVLVGVASQLVFSAPAGVPPATVHISLVSSEGLLAEDAVTIAPGSTSNFLLHAPLRLACESDPCEADLWITIERGDEGMEGQVSIDSTVESINLAEPGTRFGLSVD